MGARFFLLTILVVFAQLAQAQTLYAVSSQDRLYKLDPENCTSEYVADLEAYDIAWEQGRLYFLSGSVLMAVDPLTGQPVNVPSQTTVFGGNALCGDGLGNLYAAGHRLTRYSIATKTTTLLVDLEALGYLSQGDLAYRDGRLCLSATVIADYSSVLLRMTLDPMTVTEECGLERSSMGLAIDEDGSFYIGMGNDLYFYDQLGSGEHWIICPEIYSGALGVINGMMNAPEDLGIDWHPVTQTTIAYQPGQTLTVTLPPGTNAKDYRVVNTLGQLVKEGRFSSGTNTLDLDMFAAGAYFLNIDGEKESHKLLVP